jgi:hypothetical protein
VKTKSIGRTFAREATKRRKSEGMSTAQVEVLTEMKEVFIDVAILLGCVF